MSDFSFEMEGIGNLQEEFADEIEDWSGGKTMFVGTAVEYSVSRCRAKIGQHRGTATRQPSSHANPELTGRPPVV